MIGKFVGHAAGAASAFILAYDLFNDVAKRNKAREALELAISRLQEIDAVLNEVGSDSKALGVMSAEIHAAARDALRRYIEATRSTNCMFTQGTEPIFRLP